MILSFAPHNKRLMNIRSKKKTMDSVDFGQMEHLKFEFYKEKHIVSLLDATGYSLVRGYGKTPLEALNDLHKNLL